MLLSAIENRATIAGSRTTLIATTTTISIPQNARAALRCGRGAVQMLVAAALAALLICLHPVRAQAATVRVIENTTTVRPPDGVSGTSGAVLTGARNEFQSFQIGVWADQGAVSALSVTANGPLTARTGATIPTSAITVYREASVTITTASDSEGSTGAYPDALIPSVDSIRHEQRTAFPVSVPAGQNQMAWIDVLIPLRAPAGEYDGSVAVTADGVVSQVPVRVSVLPFTLPSTSSLGGSFDFNSNQICKVLSCPATDTPWQLQAQFAQLALDDRVSLAKVAHAVPSGAAVAQFDQYVSPLYSGTAATQLAGARETGAEIFGWENSSAGAWYTQAVADGFVNRESYHCDELSKSLSLWQGCQSSWQTAQASWTAAGGGALPVDVDVSWEQIQWAQGQAGLGPILGAIRTEVPLVNSLNDKTGADAGEQSAHYAAYANQGHAIWGYTSCESYGCTGANDASNYWNGWPGYGIDQPASEQRAMPWILFEEGLTGEYYYETAQSLTTAWTDQYQFGGNGDGNLFYPGCVTGCGGGPAIGGTHDIPIESIRLKRIRDGRQDYEYLLRLQQNGQAAQAQQIARGLFATPYGTNVTQAQIDAARAQLQTLELQIPDATYAGAVPGATGPSAVGSLSYSSPPTTTTIPLQWAPATDSTGSAITGYQLLIAPAAGGAYTTVGSTQSTRFTITALAPGGSWNVEILAMDAAGNRTQGDPYFSLWTVADTTPPAVPGSVQVRGRTGSSVTLAWTASSDDVGVSGYPVQELEAGAWTTVLTSIGTTATISGLADGVTYLFRIEAADGSGNVSAASSSISAATPDVSAPSTPAGVRATSVSGHVVTLGWTASSDNVVVAGYVVQQFGAGAWTTLQTPSGTSATINGLADGAAFSFRVEAMDAAGNTSPAATIAVSTPDVTAPSAPSALQATSVDGHSVSLRWGASADNVGVADYLVQELEAGTWTTVLTQPAITATVGGLIDGSSYSFRVEAADATGNVSAASAIVGAATPDVTAPSTPSGLRASAVTGHSVALSWALSSDNVAVTGYGVQELVSGVWTAVMSTAGVTATVSGLADGADVAFRVEAVDAAGNGSAGSSSITVATLDVSAPTSPRTVTFGSVDSASATIAWIAATDNVAVVEYRVVRGSDAAVLAAVGSADELVIIGLDPATAYTDLELVAVDAAGNQSAPAAIPVFRTLALPVVAIASPQQPLSTAGPTPIAAVAAAPDASPDVATDPAAESTSTIAGPVAHALTVQGVPPVGIRATGRTTTTMSITWRAPKSPGAVRSIVIRITVRHRTTTVIVSPRAMSVTLRHLRPGTPYTVQLTTVSSNGTSSAASPALHVRTR